MYFPGLDLMFWFAFKMNCIFMIWSAIVLMLMAMIAEKKLLIYLCLHCATDSVSSFKNSGLQYFI